jgi:hypothetical protein
VVGRAAQTLARKTNLRAASLPLPLIYRLRILTLVFLSPIPVLPRNHPISSSGSGGLFRRVPKELHQPVSLGVASTRLEEFRS